MRFPAITKVAMHAKTVPTIQRMRFVCPSNSY
jgi:hypothetical protein